MEEYNHYLWMAIIYANRRNLLCAIRMYVLILANKEKEVAKRMQK